LGIEIALVAVALFSPVVSSLAGQSTTPATLTSPAPAPDWDQVARVIVERLQFQRPERVVLVMEPGTTDPLVEALMRAIPKGGGEVAGLIPARGPTPQKWRSDYTRKAEQRPMLQLVEILRDADVGIMLPGAAATDAPYKAFQYHLNRPAGRTVRTIHFHWSGAYSLAGDPIPVTPEIAELYQRALVDTDYGALALAQRAFEAAMRSGPVRITTPAGTDLTFRIGTRVVTRQDGDASEGRAREARTLIDREIELPAGAIRVAPVETSVDGTIAFPDGLWGASTVRGLVMTIARGRVTGFTATEGRDAVARELEAAGSAGRAFREFALGFNPLLAIPDGGERFIPYYGYGAGVVRLSLGDNSELGGDVRGGYVRWNFFTDATVTAGGRTWVTGGRMTAP
jgi:leucyl aminopeptidase (aminopeptidase T)